jgi:predicted nucleic acid-binding protein
MGVILDSSVPIATERGRFDFVGFLSAHPDEVLHLAAITASELLHGCERAQSAQVRERRSQFVEAMIRDFGVVPFTLAEAREHARVWALLETTGQMIGPRDLEIAATALSLGFAVATRNLGEFRRVPGLRLLDVTPFAIG